MTVVADSRETIDGLHAYFTAAGVASQATRALGDAIAIPAATSAIVLFPDEFDVEDVVRQICLLRKTRPKLLVVAVTSAPRRFRSALDPDGHSLLPVVLPKPAFGWLILDAIREHAQGEAPA